jgi:hypothetical protein
MPMQHLQLCMLNLTEAKITNFKTEHIKHYLLSNFIRLFPFISYVMHTFPCFFLKFAPASKNVHKVKFTQVEYYISQGVAILYSNDDTKHILKQNDIIVINERYQT